MTQIPEFYILGLKIGRMATMPPLQEPNERGRNCYRLCFIMCFGIVVFVVLFVFYHYHHDHYHYHLFTIVIITISITVIVFVLLIINVSGLSLFCYVLTVYVGLCISYLLMYYESYCSNMQDQYISLSLSLSLYVCMYIYI